MAYRVVRIHGDCTDYYRMDDAASALQISRTTMRRRCKLGMVPMKRYKDRIFIPVKFVNHTLKNGWVM